MLQMVKWCCHISLFYIKPQLDCPTQLLSLVVIYRYSTSNHNFLSILNLLSSVVIYRYSTSNHNSSGVPMEQYRVVIYRYSTSNHNDRIENSAGDMLSYIVILHQTTTTTMIIFRVESCHISLFYIKPQPFWGCFALWLVVIYRYSTSNHN